MKTKETEIAIGLLNDFDKLLCEIEKKQSTDINLFYATGMYTQEIKHSAFLAWLLNPKQSHGLKNLFLKKFIDGLMRYNSKSNEYDLFSSAEDITVQSERQDNAGGRIDIFIESETTQSVMIIENKVFTTSHDNQLERYEQYVENRADWRKIFVYLTPNGDLPTENGANWLLFSYAEILEILKDISTEKLPLKLKYLIKDYTEMVNTNILLKNNDIRKLCRRIKREHAEALEILFAYSDNIEQVFDYCKKWLRENVPGLTVVFESKNYFNFYTENLKKYFSEHGEDIYLNDKIIKCRYGIGYSDTVAGGVSLEKIGEEWSNAQLKIKGAFAPDRELTGKYFSLRDYSVVIQSAKNRELEFNKVKFEIDKRLNALVEKITEFENKLKTIR